jgi:hypothetical protein
MICLSNYSICASFYLQFLNNIPNNFVPCLHASVVNVLMLLVFLFYSEKSELNKILNTRILTLTYCTQNKNLKLGNLGNDFTDRDVCHVCMSAHHIRFNLF